MLYFRIKANILSIIESRIVFQQLITLLWSECDKNYGRHKLILNLEAQINLRKEVF